MNHCNSSCSNERDIRILTETVAKGKHDIATMKDFISLVRYGPKHVSDLLVRNLSKTGEIVLSPTPFLERVREKRLQVFGRRFQVNRHVRSDKGQEKGPRATYSGKSKAAITNEHHKCLKSIANDACDESGVSSFGVPMTDLQSTMDSIQLQDRGKDILGKYEGWLKHRLEAQRKPLEQRFALSSQQKLAKAKAAAQRNAFKTQCRNLVKHSVGDDVQVFIDRLLGIRTADVPKPFKVVKPPWSASLLVLPSLHVASNVKTKKALLDPNVVSAVLRGQRITTSSYLSDVANLFRNGSDGCEDAYYKLAPSLKFESCVARRELHILIDGIWISEHPNTVRCLETCCSLTTSKWTVYRFEKKATFEKFKAKSDKQNDRLRKQVAAANKAVELRDPFIVINSIASLHDLIKSEAISDKHRSTHGKFQPRL